MMTGLDEYYAVFSEEIQADSEWGLPRSMTREQTVQTKNALQRGHKIDNMQFLGERVHLKECRQDG